MRGERLRNWSRHWFGERWGAGLCPLPLLLLLACGPTPDRVDSRLHIVSLSPAVTEILVALGARDDLVGVDRFSREVSGVGDVPSLGALFSPDLERTIELAPTLVFGVAGQQQSAFFGQLRSRGVRVETLSPYTLGEVLDSYELIGALVGRPERGSELRRSVLRELERIGAATRDETRSVAVILERDPLYVVGGGSFVSKLIEAAGGRNVFEDLDSPYPIVSLEVLAEREPQVLIDTSGAVDDPYWGGLPWSPRIETVRQGVISLPGARLPEAARILRSRIHPGAGG